VSRSEEDLEWEKIGKRKEARKRREAEGSTKRIRRSEEKRGGRGEEGSKGDTAGERRYKAGGEAGRRKEEQGDAYAS
jgi:hypothetical protein